MGMRNVALLVCSLVAVWPLGNPAALADKAMLEGVVNINTATPDELRLIPAVGPARVRNILAYRRAHPFRTVDELARIKGIGRKTIRKWRAHLAVSGPSTAEKVIRPEVPEASPLPAPPVGKPAPAPAPRAPPIRTNRTLRPPPRKGDPDHLARVRAPGMAELPPR